MCFSEYIFCFEKFTSKLFNSKVTLSAGNKHIAVNAFHLQAPQRLKVQLEPEETSESGGIPHTIYVPWLR